MNQTLKKNSEICDIQPPLLPRKNVFLSVSGIIATQMDLLQSSFHLDCNGRAMNCSLDFSGRLADEMPDRPKVKQKQQHFCTISDFPMLSAEKAILVVKKLLFHSFFESMLIQMDPYLRI